MYANLARQVREHTVERARRGRWQVLLVAPLIAGVVIGYAHREELFGLDLPVRVVAVIALVILGWTFAREVQAVLGERVTVATRDEPHIALEEVDADEVIVRVAAVPAR